MMRIKEAIQRRRLIQQLNDEYAAIDDDVNISAKNSASTLLGSHGLAALASGNNTLAYIMRKRDMLLRDADALTDDASCDDLTDHHRAYLRLHDFVNELNQHLSDSQRRALRVTWKRLSEPPKTSGRGTLQIMEKVFEKVLSESPETTSIFYRSAFIKCIEERRTGCSSGTIATIRDHAHLLIDLIDGIMCVMFDTPFHKPVWDPATIGRAHAKYIPMGFLPNIWQKLGECFAEVMFSQECVRAYPHAASAWSTLSVIVIDKMYSQTIRARNSELMCSRRICSTTSFNSQKLSLSKNASLNSVALMPSSSLALVNSGRSNSAVRNQAASTSPHINTTPQKSTCRTTPEDSLSKWPNHNNNNNTRISKEKLFTPLKKNQLREKREEDSKLKCFKKLLINNSSSSNESSDSGKRFFDVQTNRTTLNDYCPQQKTAQNNECGVLSSMCHHDAENQNYEDISRNFARKNYCQRYRKKNLRQINAILRQSHLSTSGESTNV